MPPDNEPTTAPANSETSTAPPTGTPAAPTPWRVPMDDQRVWARGKTAEELLNLTDQTVSALQQIATQPRYQAPQQAAPTEDPFANLGDDDIVDGRTLKAIAQRAQAPQQADPNVAAQMAQLALGQARQKHKDVFDRYGAEVMSNLNLLPHNAWTLDNLDRVAKLVKADHLDDFVESKAREMAASQGFTVRTTGAASGYPGAPGSGALSLESEELPAKYREALQKAGVTEAVAREFCRAEGLDFGTWLKQAAKTKSLIGEE